MRTVFHQHDRAVDGQRLRNDQHQIALFDAHGAHGIVRGEKVDDLVRLRALDLAVLNRHHAAGNLNPAGIHDGHGPEHAAERVQPDAALLLLGLRLDGGLRLLRLCLHRLRSRRKRAQIDRRGDLVQREFRLVALAGAQRPQNPARLIVLNDASALLDVLDIALGDTALPGHLLAGQLLAAALQHNQIAQTAHIRSSRDMRKRKALSFQLSALYRL